MTQPNTADGYYLVWRVDGPPPTFRHTEYSDAVTEARRLATSAPGERFVVLQSVADFIVPAPGPIETRHAHADVPF